MGQSPFDDDLPPPVRPRGVSEAPIRPSWIEGRETLDEGLSADDLRDVAHAVCGDQAEANKLMHAIVPKSSLNRRGKLTLPQSEQTDRLARLFVMAREAFQDVHDARAFMRRPHPELGNRRPIDAALTELGGRAVERILDSLLYGLPV
jgi:putative toxin-antitoxin system antitoxin component (TIGR02293 family)